MQKMTWGAGFWDQPPFPARIFFSHTDSRFVRQGGVNGSLTCVVGCTQNVPNKAAFLPMQFGHWTLTYSHSNPSSPVHYQIVFFRHLGDNYRGGCRCWV